MAVFILTDQVWKQDQQRCIIINLAASSFQLSVAAAAAEERPIFGFNKTTFHEKIAFSTIYWLAFFCTKRQFEKKERGKEINGM